jgi:hypothetical protein
MSGHGLKEKLEVGRLLLELGRLETIDIKVRRCGLLAGIALFTLTPSAHSQSITPNPDSTETQAIQGGNQYDIIAGNSSTAAAVQVGQLNSGPLTLNGSGGNVIIDDQIRALQLNNPPVELMVLSSLPDSVRE